MSGRTGLRDLLVLKKENGDFFTTPLLFFKNCTFDTLVRIISKTLAAFCVVLFVKKQMTVNLYLVSCFPYTLPPT